MAVPLENWFSCATDCQFATVHFYLNQPKDDDSIVGGDAFASVGTPLPFCDPLPSTLCCSLSLSLSLAFSLSLSPSLPLAPSLPSFLFPSLLFPPSFESKCAQLLGDVYEGLMLPLPPHLSSSESPLSVGYAKEPSSSDSSPELPSKLLEGVYGVGLGTESCAASRR